MDVKRYTRLLYLLKTHGLNMTDVARNLSCTPQNVLYFCQGKTQSIRVARAIAALTGSPVAVSQICRLPVEEIKEQAS